MTFREMYANIRYNQEVFENPQVKISKKVAAIAKRVEKASTDAEKLKELLAVMPKHCGTDLAKVSMEILENQLLQQPQELLMCCLSCRRLSSVFHKKRCPDLWASEALPKPVILRSKYVPEKRVIAGRKAN